MRRTLEELCFSRSVTVFFTSTSTSAGSHRLGDASSSPQSSEGKPITWGSEHHVPESAKYKGDCYEVIGDSEFEEEGRFRIEDK